MNSKERISLVTRNTVEVVGQEKLEALLSKKKPIAYIGYETSGDVHIGHFVTVLKLKDLEKAGFQIKILLADWHTWLNKKGDWDFINKEVKRWEKIFKQMGLKNAQIITGTSFQKTPEYIEDVFTLAGETTINRALRSMQTVARDIDNAKVTQVIYPFMQVVDMKHLKVDVAVAGMEQRKIHMMALEQLKKIDYEVPVFVHTPLIPSLKGEEAGKMSSTDVGGLISIQDDAAKIKKKIAKAYCPAGKTNPVLDIAKILVFPTYEKVEIARKKEHGGDVNYDSYEALEKDFLSENLHPGDLKNLVGEKLAEMFEKIRD